MEDPSFSMQALGIYLMIFLVILPLDVVGFAFDFPHCELHTVLGMDLFSINYGFALTAVGTITILAFSLIFLLLSARSDSEPTKPMSVLLVSLQITDSVGLIARFFFVVVMGILVFRVDYQCIKQPSYNTNWTIALWCMRTCYIVVASAIYFIVHRNRKQKTFVRF